MIAAQNMLTITWKAYIRKKSVFVVGVEAIVGALFEGYSARPSCII